MLEKKTLQPGARPSVTVRTGQTMASWPPARIGLTPGVRLIWIVNPNTPFYKSLHREFKLRPVAEFGHILFNDLPSGPGEARIGDYVMRW